MAQPRALVGESSGGRVFDEPIHGIWASDHFGLVADLALPLVGMTSRRKRDFNFRQLAASASGVGSATRAPCVRAGDVVGPPHRSGLLQSRSGAQIRQHGFL